MALPFVLGEDTSRVKRVRGPVQCQASFGRARRHVPRATHPCAAVIVPNHHLHPPREPLHRDYPVFAVNCTLYLLQRRVQRQRRANRPWRAPSLACASVAHVGVGERVDALPFLPRPASPPAHPLPPVLAMEPPERPQTPFPPAPGKVASTLRRRTGGGAAGGEEEEGAEMEVFGNGGGGDAMVAAVLLVVAVFGSVFESWTHYCTC